MIRSIVLSLALVLGSSLVAQADIWQFNVNLSGAQEVPPNGSTATGFATAFFNDATGGLSISGTFTGLTANASAAHLHGFAPAGANASVLITLTATAATSGTVSGSGSIANVGSNFTDTLGGQTYINIHNSSFPGGEIRGQMINPFAVPEPGAMVLLSLGGMLAFVRRNRKV